MNRTKQMREYSAIKRALSKAITPEQLQQAEQDKADRVNRMAIFKAERSKLNRIARNKRANDKYHATKPTSKKREVKPPEKCSKIDKMPKPMPVRMKDRIQNDLVPFKLNDRTTLMVRKGADLEAIRRRYERC